MSVDNTFQTIRKTVIDRIVTMFLYMVIVLLIFVAWCVPWNIRHLECHGEKWRIFQLFCELTNSENCFFAINVCNNETVILHNPADIH